MVQGTTLEEVARRAVDGDREALDSLVQALQGDIYGLALRMLWNREDAEDATQEILVRVVTRLSQFDFRSKLKTWVYRVAVNYILDVKKSPVERMHLNFERFADDLADGLSSDGPTDAERSLLTEEVKIGARSACSSAWTGHTGSRTCSARSSTCQDLRRLTSWRSLPTSFASAFSTHAPPSCRSRAPTVGWYQTQPRAPATGVCLRRCASEESAPDAFDLAQPSFVVSGGSRDRSTGR